MYVSHLFKTVQGICINNLQIATSDLLSKKEYFIFLSLFFSRVERSTDQVIKPVNVEALSKWVGKISPDVLRDMPVIAPMLAKLGYDPYANPPNYGKPDQKVLDNTRRVSFITQVDE